MLWSKQFTSSGTDASISSVVVDSAGYVAAGGSVGGKSFIVRVTGDTGGLTGTFLSSYLTLADVSASFSASPANNPIASIAEQAGGASITTNATNPFSTTTLTTTADSNLVSTVDNQGF
jgi:hypothetical protein